MSKVERLSTEEEIVNLVTDIQGRLDRFTMKLGSRCEDGHGGNGKSANSDTKNEDIEKAKERLATICSREYPFSDAAAAAAILDARESVYVENWREIVASVLWLLRFIPVVLCGLLLGLADRRKDFGLRFQYSTQGKHRLRNTYFAEKLSTALKKYRPAGFPFVNGDWRTLLPYLLYKPKPIHYERWWLRVPASPYGEAEDPASPFLRSRGADDDEACALDISWPEKLSAECCYLVLHGLNGGSDDVYVLDFVREANKRGAAVAVLINRGLMHTPVRGSRSIFHGARSCDVGAALDAFQLAVDRDLAIVGYSMGGILATNYAVAAGQKANCIAAISICGALSLTKILDPCGQRSRRLWQLPLTANLKRSFLAPSLRKLRLKDKGLFYTKQYQNTLQKATTVDAFDQAFVCSFLGFPSVQNYYKTMSAIGSGDAEGCTKFSNLACPLFVLHADDDPIIPYQVNFPNEAIRASPYAFFLSTKIGGHVGFSTTNADKTTSQWAFPTETAITCATAASAASRSGMIHPEASSDGTNNSSSQPRLDPAAHLDNTSSLLHDKFD